MASSKSTPWGDKFEEIVGRSPALKQVLSEVEMVAPTDATVLILGETGTGKELIARAIHRLSPRKNGPFITVNCAAFPAGLSKASCSATSEGRSPALCRKRSADLNRRTGGLCFWMRWATSRWICNPNCFGHCRRSRLRGWVAPKPIPIDVRLLAATNRNLTQMMADKLFRSDLYYRLKVFPDHDTSVARPPRGYPRYLRGTSPKSTRGK